MDLEVRDSHVRSAVTLTESSIYDQRLCLPTAINAALKTKADGCIRVIIRAGGTTLSTCDAHRHHSLLGGVDWPLDTEPGDRAKLTALNGGSVLTIDLSA